MPAPQPEAPAPQPEAPLLQPDEPASQPEAPAPQPDEPAPRPYGLVAVAIVVALLVLTTAYQSHRYGGVDEIGLYNPTYMDFTYGKITYPVHGFFNEMVVHPPVHYKGIAALMRAGLGLYYAQATPVVALAILGMLITISSRMPWPVQAGFLFGLWMTFAAFLKFGLELFGMRPEGAVNAAWLASLAALESARAGGWSRPRLFLGALLAMYTASLHYYAAAAVLAVVVYAVAAFLDLGWRRGRTVALVLGAGCLVYAIPFVALWVWPYQTEILKMIQATRQGGGVAASIREHARQYAEWARLDCGFPWLKLAFSTGVPLTVASTLILLVYRGTRVLALAALPLPLFVLLLAWHKHGYYFVHEIAIFGIASAAGATAMLALGIDRIPRPRVRRIAEIAVCAGLIVSLWQGTQWFGGALWSSTPKIHEQEVARAAGRELLGANARVASRISLWYGAGAADWHDPTQAMFQAPGVSAADVAAYVARFDGVAESNHMSNYTWNTESKGILGWYLEGVLKLRGFFFAQANSALSYLLFRARPGGTVAGYGARAGTWYRFDADSKGDYEFVTFAGTDSPVLTAFRIEALLNNIMTLPAAASIPGGVLTMAVVRPGAEIPPGHRMVERIRVARIVVDARAMVERLRREDRPIRFHHWDEIRPPVKP